MFIDINLEKINELNESWHEWKIFIENLFKIIKSYVFV